MNSKKDEVASEMLEYLRNMGIENHKLKFNITPLEWEIFTSVLYEYAEDRQLMDCFYDILRLVVDNALVKYIANIDNKFPIYLIRETYEKRYVTNAYFTIDTLVNSLWTLHAFKFRKHELFAIKEEIRKRCQLGEKVDIKILRKK